MDTRSVFPSCHLPLAIAAGILLVATSAARAADADPAQSVECLLPGQIHTVGGHATMGPRRPIQTTPADCRQRGGEYTIPQPVPQTAPSTTAGKLLRGANDWVRCLLPKQLRQIGEKKSYYTTNRIVHATRTSCQSRHGSVLSVLRRNP